MYLNTNYIIVSLKLVLYCTVTSHITGKSNTMTSYIATVYVILLHYSWCTYVYELTFICLEEGWINVDGFLDVYK